MRRREMLLAIGLGLMVAATARAQLFGFSRSTSIRTDDWAAKMFDSVNHDFNTVPRGAEAVHVFTITNPYDEAVRIAQVKKTCGCTAAKVDKTTLVAGEQARLEVHLDTRRFTGRKDSAVTVVFDRPQYGQVRLRFTSYIRRDVVVEPGGVNFGTIDQGEEAQREATISYAGRSDWRIDEVECRNPYLQVDLEEASRRGGRVAYRLKVQVKPDSPAGYFRDEIRLVTNDGSRSALPVLVEIKIQPALSVSPGSLYLGVVPAGTTVTKPVVVRAKKPFRVTKLEMTEGDDTAFSYKLPEQARAVHVIPITFTAGKAAGRCACTIRVETDLPEHSTALFSAYAQVREQGQG